MGTPERGIRSALMTWLNNRPVRPAPNERSPSRIDIATHAVKARPRLPQHRGPTPTSSSHGPLALTYDHKRPDVCAPLTHLAGRIQKPITDDAPTRARYLGTPVEGRGVSVPNMTVRRAHVSPLFGQITTQIALSPLQTGSGTQPRRRSRTAARSISRMPPRSKRTAGP